ncbi:MerR family transcriptional regulator [Iamia sp. SCSIO 61187]|uniref:MerR family transcriptional regulator n=1 Tax=Iamia sp. SCSIO 61187 TaxID=2722752 RepID=UPI001C62CF3F|nr:MerR family transcriptional regulator [Iamia sp. SCSIO 61187]QYG93837.1 MerR family transcriptional regulator [Iamia sp. SCSIO 61187]
MADEGRKVGEVAEATGLTVRTLHHYDEIGLLVASGRTPSGHRLYAPADIERLYRICLLRRLGLPLDEIGSVLDDPGWDTRSALVRHRLELERRMAAEARLRTHLVRIESLDGDDGGPPTEDLLRVLEEMTMLDTAVQRRIGILVYEDLEAIHDHLVGVYGLGPAVISRDDDGRPIHVEVQAGDGVLWLHPAHPDMGYSSPRTAGTCTAMTAVMVDDCDAHFRHASEHGADVRYEPVDQPYGYREWSSLDPEGGFWSFMQPLG